MKAPALNTMLPDLLALLKQRATSTTIEDELAQRDSELRTKFARIFEQPPHVDELLEQPVARIKLKDQNHCIKT